jgi:hypothetical protein
MFLWNSKLKIIILPPTSKPRMKLHHLLQKCSFFLIKLAALAAGGRAEQRTAEYRRMVSLRSVFF